MAHDDADAAREEFLRADNSDRLIDAFLKLIPDEATAVGEVCSVGQRPKFMRKLDDIRAAAAVKLDAALEYSGAKIMRDRWDFRNLPRDRIARLDDNLVSIFNSENDALEERRMDEAGEARRGRELLNRCKARSETLQLVDFTIDPAVAKGELHCLANGEGYVPKEITWKR